MGTRACDGCSDQVRVAGGIANLWTLESGPSGGLTLELDDGTEYFLCFACVEALPEDATAEDLAALEE
ncbi:MAG: hypothetical protein ABEH59_08965 [Halobacteriales archaeon]